MNQWRIGEFSKLTGVSVRTLHHYDQIGLLKASKNQMNGFRLYEERDLQVLLKILSLKFLGFDLLVIKGLLDKTIPIKERFLEQKKILDKKINILSKASKILSELTETSESLPSDLILKLIELYRVSHYLEKMCTRKVLPELTKKAKEYSQKISHILQQIDNLSNEEILVACSVILAEVYELIPNAMQHG